MTDVGAVFRVGRRDAGRRLDRFLKDRIPSLSRTAIQRTLVDRVRISWGDAPRPSSRVPRDGRVEVLLPVVEESPQDTPMAVLARGPHWVVADKPAGCPVHPCHDVRINSAILRLRRQLGRPRLALCHRLDRGTSGALLVADDDQLRREIGLAFEARRVCKEYRALVVGHLVPDRGTFDGPIDTRPALSEFEVLERRDAPARTLLRLEPQSGRRHQLRIHLAGAGHPIVGDARYGDGRPQQRLWLHSRRLALEAAGAEIAAVAPLPTLLERRR